MIAASAGDTLQAVRGMRYADPWTEPGERDLTAHVDFEALGEAAAERGRRGPRTGAAGRMAGRDGHRPSRRRAGPGRARRAAEIAAARDRLVAPAGMGRLFKVMAFRSGWPEPAGFE
jgi:NADH dehydrogenase [ubiquinone] 1 alpha subcomplex assembly factor 7